MNTRLWLQLVVSLVLVGSCLAIPFVPQSTVPFGVMTYHHQLVIVPSSQGLPLPADLQTHDALRFDKMSPSARLPFVTSLGNPPAGTTLNLTVGRDGQILPVPVQFVALPPTFTNRVTTFAGILLLWLQVALALLLLWRGRHKAAAGVAVWCLVEAINGLVTSMPITPLLLSLWLGAITGLVEQAGTLIGLLLVAEGLARSEINNRWWRLHRPVFAVLLSIYIGTQIAVRVRIYLSGLLWSDLESLAIAVHLATFALPIAMILFSYSRISDANRARIRWFLASMLGIVAAYVMAVLPQLVPISGLTAAILQMLFTGIALCGFTYAVLRHQLVSIRLVINRALAYGIITSLIVGVFALLSALLERNTLGEGTNRLLELLVPLLLGITLHSVKKYVDVYINKWFFRRRYRAETALNHFARTCAYIDQPANLLKLTADELFRNSGAQSIGVYLIDPATTTGRCVETRGTPLAVLIETDDLALVRLRAGDTEIDLHEVVTAFGNDGFAFPMAMRNKLIGVIACGARPAEQYTADERKLFAHVASQVAVALHTLELQEQQQVLSDIAAGALQSLPDIRSRAQALLAPHLAV
ncbi:MAG TPA: GAF domain-containing protein [Gammaproteobacteria bacterium]|nr:GAF domain-containing protein [Gammaproteobacteria bacterium]